MVKDIQDDVFSEENEVKIVYKTIKFGRVGDYFKGTLINNTRTMQNNLSEKKEMQTIFELKAKEGSLHLITDRQVDPNATKIVAGEDWSFITGKTVMLKALEKAKIGQIIGLKFTEEKKAGKKGFNPAKIIKIFLGKMDDEWLKSQEEQGDGIEFN